MTPYDPFDLKLTQGHHIGHLEVIKNPKDTNNLPLTHNLETSFVIPSYIWLCFKMRPRSPLSKNEKSLFQMDGKTLRVSPQNFLVFCLPDIGARVSRVVYPFGGTQVGKLGWLIIND